LLEHLNRPIVLNDDFLWITKDAEDVWQAIDIDMLADHSLHRHEYLVAVEGVWIKQKQAINTRVQPHSCIAPWGGWQQAVWGSSLASRTPNQDPNILVCVQSELSPKPTHLNTMRTALQCLTGLGRLSEAGAIWQRWLAASVQAVPELSQYHSAGADPHSTLY
jgi:hypothetical protein